jgi:multiple sugar transport system substrate-binding protein
MARIAVMYNTELFKQAGIPVPGLDWTYDQLATMLPKLTRHEGGDVAQWGLGIGWGELTTMISIFRAWGGDVFTADGKRSTLTAPPVGAALRWHLDRFLRDRTLALPAAGINVQRLFTDGKAAMWGRNNPGAAGNLIPFRGQLSWGMTLMPKGPGGRRGGMLQSSAMSMTRDSRQRDEAWQLQKWMTDRETGVLFALASKGSLTPGARPDVYRDPRFLGRPDLPPGVQDVARRSMEEREPFLLAWNFRGTEIDKVLNEAMGKLLRGESAPETGFLQDLHGRLQAILDQPRPGKA